MDVGGGGTEGGAAVVVVAAAGDEEERPTAAPLRSQGFGGETMMTGQERMHNCHASCSWSRLVTTADHRMSCPRTPDAVQLHQVYLVVLNSDQRQ